MKKITFEELKQLLLYRQIVEWNKNEIVLDNRVKIKIEETEHDCCAQAYGEFDNVVLEAVITDIMPIEYDSWKDGDTYGCSAKVTFLHNKNIICSANANADAGNGGYYFSIASFIITSLESGECFSCHFVGSDD